MQLKTVVDKPTDAEASRDAAFLRAAGTWPTIQELAEAYGVSHSWVRGLVERGFVESVVLGAVRVNEADFVEHVMTKHSPRQR